MAKKEPSYVVPGYHLEFSKHLVDKLLDAIQRVEVYHECQNARILLFAIIPGQVGALTAANGRLTDCLALVTG
ncbi:MAG: hypothetical protein IPJ90_19995 [Anaerolineaceae bacterium]|nr:hypothetical protein [Anaerolineaceae bacterium]